MPRESAQTRWGRPRRAALLGALGLIALLVSVLAAGPATAPALPATAAAPLEGVWSFSAGKIAIQAEPNGTFSGTVVAPTKFSQCIHPVGEQIWSEMREQPDGSFWGLHQWYFATEQCIQNPTLGQTAWRELQSPSGGHFLRVCFSEPGSNSQPTISPGGSVAHATFGCNDSALISALPAVTGRDFERYVRLPDTGSCLARKKLTIRIRDPKNDPFTKVVVKLRSGATRRSAKLHRHGATTIATLDLRGLTAPSFVVTVRLRTALGEHLFRKRTYRNCVRKRHRHRHHRHRAP